MRLLFHATVRGSIILSCRTYRQTLFSRAFSCRPKMSLGRVIVAGGRSISRYPVSVVAIQVTRTCLCDPRRQTHNPAEYHHHQHHHRRHHRAMDGRKAGSIAQCSSVMRAPPNPISARTHPRPVVMRRATIDLSISIDSTGKSIETYSVYGCLC